MPLTRRKLLASVAAIGMATAFAPAVRADDENDSIWDILQHNARMKSVDPDKNTMAALATIDTPEPILSFDTANNILTMSNGTQIDTTTGLQIIDTSSMISMANGAYLDTKNSILHMSDGTQIDTVTGLKITT